MKKYRFQMTSREVRELYFKVLRKKEEKRGGSFLRSAGRAVLMVVLVMALLGMGGIVFPSAPGIALLVLPIFWGIKAYNYSLFKKMLCQETRVVWIEDGCLKVEAEGKQHIEYSGSNIGVVRTTPRLLALGIRRASKQTGWYPIPLRVFADEKEREEFVECIRSLQTDGGAVPDMGAHGEQVYFHQTFQIGGEEWVKLMTDAVEAIQAGDHGGSAFRGRQGKSRLVWIGIGFAYLVFLCVAAWLYIRGISHAEGIFCAALLMGFILSIPASSRFERPEKNIRRHMEKGNARDTCGDFEISVTETGIWQSIQNPASKTAVMEPWGSLRCVVEMDSGLFFFQKDSREFIAFLKGNMEDREQIEGLKGLCREKQVDVVAGKQKKPMPGWISPLLKMAGTLLLTAFMFVWVFAEPREAVPPDPVPLEEQVSVLRSLGFTVPEKMVESLYGFQEDDNTASYVENYPYTWLLTDLAWADEDEEWAEYFQDGAEVFWFDFEGWDISEDYIWILEGMRELCAGSILDDVENIREDTANADWEKGTGTITVSLEWKGRERSWDMDVVSDWIDWHVLEIYNGLLKEDGIPERFYAAGDGGQGALVFYGNKEWALAFEKATGLELEAY